MSSAAFGKYEILERIAAGEATELYKARLSGIGGFSRKLAIKRIQRHRNKDQAYVDAFVAEARRAGLLSHANIIQIIDLGQIDGAWFVAMEFVDGPDLARVLERCRVKSITLPVPHAVFICLEMLKGLVYAHTRQVMRGNHPSTLRAMHHNLSPQKVLLSVQGEVKLTDFANPDREGHPHYRAPEQARGEADERSDLYTCGVILYEMLTGRRPEGPEPAPASHINGDVPVRLDEILSKTLRADPSQRPASASALKEGLDRFFQDMGFIFTQNTLAGFLKRLFPNPHHLRPQALEEQETRLLDRLPEELLAEAKTRITRPPQKMDLREHFPIADTFTQHTQPIVDDDNDDQTMVESGVDAWAEAQTLIRTDPTKSPPAEALEATRSSTMVTKAPVIPPPPPRLPPAPGFNDEKTATLGPAPRPASPASPASERSLWILFTALSVGAMVGTLLIGFMVGRQTADRGVAPSAAIEIELQIPDEVQLYLDDELQRSGSVQLQGDRHVLRVEAAAPAADANR
ncbi:MAG: serine/threonine-protein kinase [Myxococcota bacterium]